MSAKEQRLVPWTKEEIRLLLLHSDKAVVKAIACLSAMQTDTERLGGYTIELNGRGFNSYDAEGMSRLSARLKRDRSLSPMDISWARAKLLKYAGQLQKVAERSRLETLQKEFKEFEESVA